MKPMSLVRFAAAAAMATTFGALATPIVINAQLTGDARVGSPDNLVVDVSITGDTTSNVVNFKFDINSPLHPNIKLDEFYFNVLGLGGDYSFSNFTPSDWAISTPASTAGGGNISFLFEAAKSVANGTNVTNTQDLLFSMTKSTGNFTAADFLNSAVNCGSDPAMGCGQLGAHLQSLTAGAGESDSGFAVGNYSSSSSNSSGPTSGSGNIPEPGSGGLVFAGLGLLCAGFGVRHRARRG